MVQGGDRFDVLEWMTGIGAGRRRVAGGNEGAARPPVRERQPERLGKKLQAR